EVPLETALDIYNRLLHLGADEARIITTRALAHIGEHAVEAEVWPALMARSAEASAGAVPAPEDGAPGEPDPATAAEEGVSAPAAVRGKALFWGLRQRIRGRVNDELRQRIELAAARTEVALLRRHTD